MIKKLLVLLFPLLGYASDAPVDVGANPVEIIDSTASEITKANPFNVQIDIAGAVIDPRTRTWNLGFGFDSVTAFQGGSWAVNASQSGAWNVTLLAGSATIGSLNNISGTISLPTGASTAAKQDTGNTSLAAIQTSDASIDSKTPPKGAATTANSTPVNIASDQTVNTSVTSSVLPTGAATSANQTTEISNLGTIGTNTANTASNTSTQITQLSAIFAAQANGTQKSQVVNSAGTSVDATAMTAGSASSLVGLWANAKPALLNGTTYDPQRSVQGLGNGTTGGGLPAGVSYGQYSPTLPTPASNTYTAIQTDLNGRLYNVPAEAGSTASSSATVGVTSGSALTANATRKGLSLVNASSAKISCSFGATAVLNAGITLYPGGSYSMKPEEYSAAALNCIASLAASPLSIQEWTK